MQTLRARPLAAADQGTQGAVLLTGATGFVGMELLARLLERTQRPVIALVRGSHEADAQQRLLRTLDALLGTRREYEDRVVALCADLERPALGLTTSVDELAAVVGDIVHAAASVSFTLPLEEARAINVEGTRRCSSWPSCCTAQWRPAALRVRLDRVRRRRRTRRRSARTTTTSGRVPQHLRAHEIGGRAARARARRAAAGPGLPAEHRRRRAGDRLDRGVQRHLRAAARVREAARCRCAGAALGAGRRRAGRLRRRRDLRALAPGGRAHLPPGRRRRGEDGRRAGRLAAGTSADRRRGLPPALYRRTVHPLSSAPRPRRRARCGAARSSSPTSRSRLRRPARTRRWRRWRRTPARSRTSTGWSTSRSAPAGAATRSPVMPHDWRPHDDRAPVRPSTPRFSPSSDPPRAHARRLEGYVRRHRETAPADLRRRCASTSTHAWRAAPRYRQRLAKGAPGRPRPGVGRRSRPSTSGRHVRRAPAVPFLDEPHRPTLMLRATVPRPVPSGRCGSPNPCPMGASQWRAKRTTAWSTASPQSSSPHCCSTPRPTAMNARIPESSSQGTRRRSPARSARGRALVIESAGPLTVTSHTSAPAAGPHATTVTHVRRGVGPAAVVHLREPIAPAAPHPRCSTRGFLASTAISSDPGACLWMTCARSRPRHGASINDVLLAAVAGALREFLLRSAERPPTRLKAMVPVNVRDTIKATTCSATGSRSCSSTCHGKAAAPCASGPPDRTDVRAQGDGRARGRKGRRRRPRACCRALSCSRPLPQVLASPMVLQHRRLERAGPAGCPLTRAVAGSKVAYPIVPLAEAHAAVGGHDDRSPAGRASGSTPTAGRCPMSAASPSTWTPRSTACLRSTDLSWSKPPTTEPVHRQRG